jgi:hypothetical protein
MPSRMMPAFMLLPKLPIRICTMFSGQPVDTLLEVPLMISVLVIDDDPIALQGCRRVLEDAGISPIFCAIDLEAAYQLLLSHRGYCRSRIWRRQSRRIGVYSPHQGFCQANPFLVFRAHRNPTIVAQALQADASGYVLKDDAHSEGLVKAVLWVSTSPTFTCGDRARGGIRSRVRPRPPMQSSRGRIRLRQTAKPTSCP